MNTLEWNEEAHKLLKNLEWSGSVNTEELQVSACPFCYGWKPNSGDDKFWDGRSHRKGHQRDCYLDYLIKSHQ